MELEIIYRYTRFANRQKMFPHLKQPDGSYLCRWCHKPLKYKRSNYCDSICAGEVNIRCGFGVESAVRKRDHEVCAKCGLDCIAVKEAFLELYDKLHEPSWGKYSRYHVIEPFKAFVAASGLRSWWGRNWDAHHIVAVKDGGGACGLDNYITLCWRCHKKAHGSKKQSKNFTKTLALAD